MAATVLHAFGASMPDADRHRHATLVEDPNRYSGRPTTVPTDANAPLVDAGSRLYGGGACRQEWMGCVAQARAGAVPAGGIVIITVVVVLIVLLVIAGVIYVRGGSRRHQEPQGFGAGEVAAAVATPSSTRQ